MHTSAPLAADRRIGCFVTPHGYGHAARACAVMGALLTHRPGTCFDVFTRVPEWFFQSALGGAFTYHDLLTDVGLAQKTALSEDVPETVRRLGQLVPFNPGLVSRLAEQLQETGCRLIMCDIAPLGIVVAREAGIPSVLIENFTWDWIYEGYLAQDGRLRGYIDYLADVFASVDYRVQTEPVSRRVPCDLTAAPVSRANRTPAAHIRRDLGIPEGAQVVMVTMGGFSWQYRFLELLASRPDVHFVVPVVGDGQTERGRPGALPDNLVSLPHHSNFFHPDLVNASDAVIGKVGYSTVAEVYWSGVAFGYVPRQQFRESQALVAFVEREMCGLPISDAEFDGGRWLSLLPDLLALPRVARSGLNGAEQVAQFVDDLLGQ